MIRQITIKTLTHFGVNVTCSIVSINKRLGFVLQFFICVQGLIYVKAYSCKIKFYGSLKWEMERRHRWQWYLWNSTMYNVFYVSGVLHTSYSQSLIKICFSNVQLRMLFKIYDKESKLSIIWNIAIFSLIISHLFRQEQIICWYRLNPWIIVWRLRISSSPCFYETR